MLLSIKYIKTPTRRRKLPGERAQVQVQLLTAIDREESGELLSDDRWCAQPKHDGRRVVIRRCGPVVTATGRSGKPVSIGLDLAASIRACRAKTFTIDGELVAGGSAGLGSNSLAAGTAGGSARFFAFDLLESSGGGGISPAGPVDLRDEDYSDRLSRLRRLIVPSECLAVTATALGRQAKRAMFERLEAAGAEGIVFKRLDAPYRVGRSTDQVKLKFWKSASFIVTAAGQTANSVTIGLLDGAAVRSVGNVGTAGIDPAPIVGDIVEVRYLNVHPSGMLCQPTLLEVRDDLEPSDCSVAQLQLKSDRDAMNRRSVTVTAQADGFGLDSTGA
jgi:bifunctional non-homologous end joining protein LigD